MEMFDPAHPGMLIADVLESGGLKVKSVSALARHLGVTRAKMSRVIKGKIAVFGGFGLAAKGCGRGEGRSVAAAAGKAGSLGGFAEEAEEGSTTVDCTKDGPIKWEALSEAKAPTS